MEKAMKIMRLHIYERIYQSPLQITNSTLLVESPKWIASIYKSGCMSFFGKGVDRRVLPSVWRKIS